MLRAILHRVHNDRSHRKRIYLNATIYQRFISLEEKIFFAAESVVQVLIFGIMCNQLLCVVLLYAFSDILSIPLP